jgi:hypothetical protein
MRNLILTMQAGCNLPLPRTGVTSHTAKVARSLAEMGRVETLEGGEKDGFRIFSSS